MKYLIIGALAAISVVAPSDAAILNLTFSGTLTSGEDNTGVFGSDTDLANQAVSVRFTIDTSRGTRTDTTGRRDYIGGFFYPAGTPVISGAITVAGVTHTVNFPIFGNLIETIPPHPFGDYIEAQVSQSSENQTGPVLRFDSIFAFSGSASNGQLTPNGFDKPFTYITTPRDNNNATFTVFARDTTTDIVLEDASGAFSPKLVTLAVANVPEPASWAMMVGGFGVMGGLLRRRRPVVSHC